MSVATTGIRIGYLYPAGTTTNICFSQQLTTAGASAFGCETTSSTSFVSTGTGGTTELSVTFEGTITTSTTSGLFQFLFDATAASTVTINIGSNFNACPQGSGVQYCPVT
jgi:hypothetical protein